MESRYHRQNITDPNYMLLDNIQLKLLYMKRTYKAWCSMTGCNKITHVHNSDRVGGMCINCRKRFRAAWMLGRNWRKYKLRQQKSLVFWVMMYKIPGGCSMDSGLCQNVCRYL